MAVDASERALRALVDALPQMAWSAARDGSCELFSRSWERYTGLGPDATRGAGWLNGIHPDDRARALVQWQASVLSGEELEVEVRIPRATDGEPLWHVLRARAMRDDAGRVVRWLGTCAEIHHLKTIEARLLENERRLAGIVETIADAIFIVDAGGRIVFANAMAEKLVGLKRTDITDRMHDDARWALTTLDGRPFPEEELPAARVFRDGENVFGVELCVQRPGGEYIAISCNAAPLRNDAGEITAVVVSVTDITKRKEVEHMKDTLVSTVSHELRTPLSSLLGFSELMLAREYPEEKRREFLTIVHDESKRLANLVNDFLDLQRMESGRCTYSFKTLDVAQVFEGLPHLFAGQGDEARVVVERPASPLCVTADADRLKQVLTNLVSNGLKFSGRDASVTLSAHAVGGEVVIAVSDRGVGIPKESLGRLFSKFFRVENEATKSIGGTGLGLAIVKEIVEAHGGRAWAESELGRGTTIRVALPRAAAARTTTGERHARDTAARVDVFVVEDDPSYALLLAEHLSAEGLAVESTPTGEEALVRVRAAPPRLVILDLQLAGRLDGLDVLIAIKNDRVLAEIPVMVLSANEILNVRGLALAGCDFLVKPASPERMLAAIRGRIGSLDAARIVVADDDPSFRRQVRETLAAHAKIDIVEASCGRDALASIAAGMPNLLMLDLAMPEIDGFEVLARLRADKAALNLPTLVITAKDLAPAERAFLRRGMATLVRKQDSTLEHIAGVVKGLLGTSTVAV